ncbi:hypothetical protein ACSQ67_006131 [Phaseolus vulgaris]
MGNCCQPASSMEWDGEDWSDLTSKTTGSSKGFDQTRGRGLSLGKVQKEKLMGALKASPDANGKVKIMISKKELAELLEKPQQVCKKQVGRSSAELVLLRLIKARYHQDSRHELWRPVLESIPENATTLRCDENEIVERKTCPTHIPIYRELSNGISFNLVNLSIITINLIIICENMGNCCKPASSMEWDGEDWSDLTSKKSSPRKVIDENGGNVLSLGKVQKEKLMEAARASPDANGKVKIMISKKELAELLEKPQQVCKKKQVGRSSAELVLLRLIKARDREWRHGLWMPVLETIPEATCLTMRSIHGGKALRI